jgi:chemotaxis protein histidine kinase CheA
MSDELLLRLFQHQAKDTLEATAELLAEAPQFPLAGETFFRHVHDLKAAALASNLPCEAERLHGLEDMLWRNRDKLMALQAAQAQMKNWFSEAGDLEPVPLREALKLLAVRAHDQGKTLGKYVDVRVGLEGLPATEVLLPGAWAALVHIVHNSLVHGVGETSMMWINAYRENWQLVLVVEDDGTALNESSTGSLMAGRGVGLNAIRQRMTSYRGQFSLGPSKRGGTKAMLRFPVADKKIARAS